MVVILGQQTEYFPVWFAIAGDKIVCAQEQAYVIESFRKRYKRDPDLVINGLYAAKAKPNASSDDSRGSLGEG